MSGQLFLSLCRDRHHRHRTRSTHNADIGIMGLMPRAGLCRIEF